MSEIPEDIMKTAKASVCDNFETGEQWSTTISKAILTERERCWFLVKEKAEGDIDFAAFLIMKGEQ